MKLRSARKAIFFWWFERAVIARAARMCLPLLSLSCRCRHPEDKQRPCSARATDGHPRWRGRGAGCASDKRCGLLVGFCGLLRGGNAARRLATTVVIVAACTGTACGQVAIDTPIGKLAPTSSTEPPAPEASMRAFE